MNKWICLSLLGAGLLSGGCAGYKLGPTTGFPAGAKSVRVNFFENKTLEPRLVVAVNRAMKKQLQQDGSFALKTSGSADFVLNGEITDFRRNGISYVPGDTLTVQDYSLSLTAKVTVTERATGGVVLEKSLTGSTVVRVGNDFTAGQRQAVPLIASELARSVTDMLTIGEWPGEAAPEANNAAPAP